MPFSRAPFRTAALALAAAALPAACTDGPSLPRTHVAAPAGGPALNGSGACVSIGITRGETDVNADLNEFGRILHDADESPYEACVDSAAAIMTDKINATLNTNPRHFASFNSGAVVALIFAAADRIGSRGGMTPALDAALRRVEAGYGYNEADDGCTLQSTDNCMDGHSVAASGFAWIAAYRHLRGDDPTQALASTRAHVAATFANACIFKGYGHAQLCKDPSEPVTAADVTMSFNVGHQHIGYGFGLMTSIAAAVVGYELTGNAFQFSSRDTAVAIKLFEEAQRKVIGQTTFRQCPHVHNPGGVWQPRGDSIYCGGHPDVYQPQMYALDWFYQAEFGQVPGAGTYTSSVFDAGLFRNGAQPYAFFSWGRYETYGKLAYEWRTDTTPTRHLSWTDAHAPHGWVDGFDGSRNLVGWACDRDVPGRSVRVTLRAPNRPAITRRADIPSEQAIASQCGGGLAHRFAIPVPAEWAGLTVSATVTDYFGFRSAGMGCSQCVVPPPPTASVAWVHPSSVTWGPANTLTVGGYAHSGAGGVRMEWRETTFDPEPAWNVAPSQPAPDGSGQWFNTVPVSNHCRTYQVRAVYSGVTSAVHTFNGRTAGYCAVRIIWVQPQSRAGIGAPGSLVVAGEATGAGPDATIILWYRDLTTGGDWIRREYEPVTDPNGIWLNDALDADPNHQYEVWADYDGDRFNHSCVYQGNDDITWC